MSQRHRVFARMWGVLVLAHLAGNWAYGDIAPDVSVIGLLLAGAGVVATVLVVRPRKWSMVASAVVVPITVVLEAPVLGNHWLLAGFVAIAYLLTAGDWQRFEPAARWILVVFYAFAAFAKLNTGFLDPATSCGVYYADQWLESFGLPPVGPSGVGGWLAAWGSAVVEIAVVPLLLVRRTRPYGVLLAVVFHGLISLDLGQHFYDFTAVLLPLFVLFLPDDYFAHFEQVADHVRPTIRHLVAGVVAVVGLGVTVVNITPLTQPTAWFLQPGTFLWWVPYLALVTWSVARSLRSIPLRWNLVPAAVFVVALVVVNGLTPYLELKTAYGWNMYSNLVTVDGDSNHLIVPATLPLREGHDDLVEILESDDPGLQVYADENYLLPWPSFRSYVVDRLDIAVTFRRGGDAIQVERIGGRPALTEPVPWWWRWMPLRAIAADEPDRCQPAFLPAL